MQSVQRLYQYRKSISTKPFNARGKKVNRCEHCRVAVENCICCLVHKSHSKAGFLLLMYDTEVLKPSNTGRLIADIFDDTYAFLWQRTQAEKALTDLLNDTCWQPMIVFPGEYATSEEQVFVNELPCLTQIERNNVETRKRPLFILLDGSWREAKKMYRKSDYLRGIPVVSFDPKLLQSSSTHKYVRKSVKDNQLATAEVAANMLGLLGENYNAKLLALWFDVFNYQYQKSVCQINRGNVGAIEDFTDFLKKNK
ncbi:tRNA-uridine aminocarboxypropyltransferase [Thalassotalea atypica]|uniref:tRNA-uridine aminocarboxypropyltransferase n=1 Tax=Thalassotalea atypica TaxID=2054316 RepID=UPI0025728EE1|nr:DTW domain-containing protein [Thalassotalea atypica]